MTLLLALDPGKSTGWALGFYDDETPYTLLERGEILNGLDGFIEWWLHGRPTHDRRVVEKFILDSKNAFAADLTPRDIEGALRAMTWDEPVASEFQLRSAKYELCAYPPEADTKEKRQRVRFQWLQERGLGLKGSAHDDGNDACSHALIALRRARHIPTLLKYWPPRAINDTLVPNPG